MWRRSQLRELHRRCGKRKAKDHRDRERCKKVVHIVQTVDRRTNLCFLIFVLGGLVALPLIFTQLVLELRSGTSRQSQASGMDVPQFEGGEHFRDLKTWGWLVGLLVAVWLLGFMVAVPLFVFVFSIIHGARWYISVFLSAMAFGLLYGIFDVVVHVSWPEPFVLRWLGN